MGAANCYQEAACSCCDRVQRFCSEERRGICAHCSIITAEELTRRGWSLGDMGADYCPICKRLCA